MFKQPQVNNTDSVKKSISNTDTGNTTSLGTKKTIKAQEVVIKPIPKTSTIEQDTLSTTILAEKVLFTVPYRCTLNRDSLKAAMRKVVFEIDTIPKGLNLIATESSKDTTLNVSPQYTESIFTHHLLSTKKIELKPKLYEQQNWMLMTFLSMLLLIGILRVFYQKKFNLFINAFISKRFSNQIIREENALTQSTSVVLSIVFFVSISLFFYLVSKHFNKYLLGYNDIQNFLAILIICVCFYFIKLFFNKLGGYIFKINKETDEYIFNQFLVIQILGLMLTIWCILLNYSTNFNKEIIIYGGFATLTLGFIVRMIKNLGIVNMNTYSPVYIFLYLCTLEILPLLIIIKMVIR